MKIKPGTYDGRTVAATIYEAPSGAVMWQAQIDMGDGVVMRGGICLIQKDGTLSERGFRDVQAIMGWSTWDWDRFGGEPESHAGHIVQCVIETVQGEKGEFSSVKYVNPPGGGMAMLVKADAKSLAAKFGAKTRALFGGATASAPRAVAPVTPKPPAPMPQPPKAKPAPAAVKPSTMEHSWDAFCKAHDGKPEAELYDIWPVAIREACGKDQNDCTPEDWGRVMASFDNIPM
jgi:hypothetical protein